MSTSCAAATTAAGELDGVSVIDTKNLSTGSGLLLMYACDLREAGETKEEIVRKVSSRVPSVQASFIIDKLNYLYKGGRCSGVALFAATALNLKPCIKVKDGKMIVGKKYRFIQCYIYGKIITKTRVYCLMKINGMKMFTAG